MPRGRHRSVSTATRISLLAAICAPALVAVVLAVVAGGATTLRLAVLLGVFSAGGAIVWVVRGSTAHHRRLAEESIARRRERERMAEELRAAIKRADEHELAALRAGELTAAHLVSRPQRLTPDLFARGAAVLDLLDRRAGVARPTAPSIVPAVRRPPVSAPDLVPAYAASVFGPTARSAGRGGAGVATGTRSAEPAPDAGRSAVRAGTGTTAVASGAPTSVAGGSVARSESASTAVAPNIAGPAEGRATTSSGTAPTDASAPAAVRSAARGESEDAGEVGSSTGARPGAPIAPPAELSRSVARPAAGATAEGAPEATPAEVGRAESTTGSALAESPPSTIAAPDDSASAPAEAPADAPDAPAKSSAAPAPTTSIAPEPTASAPAEASAPAPAGAPTPTPAHAGAATSASETAEVTRMVRDKVLEVTRRVAGSGASGRFDFFAPRAVLAEPEATGFLTDELFGPDAYYDALVAGRPHGDEIAPAEATSAPEAAVDDIEADGLADPVRAEEAPAGRPAPVHRGHGVRFAPSESDRARPGVPRPKPLPVDLTAHDDTEEIPRIDIRKHA